MKKQAIKKINMRDIISNVASSLIEREDVSRLIGIAILSETNVFLIGQPGTAKSLAISRFVDRIDGAIIFKRLLTKYSTPEELFGALSIPALERGEYERCVDGMLPTSHFAFVDECFKANSSILNSLLTIMNEKEFSNGRHLMNVPLISLIGASNELPEGNELNAMFDRFMIRRNVKYINSESGFRELLSMNGGDGNKIKMRIDDVYDAIDETRRGIRINGDVIDAIVSIKIALEKEGFIFSDRRWRESMRVIKAAAYVNERTTATPADAAVLADVMNTLRGDDDKKIRNIINTQCDPVGTKLLEWNDQVDEIYRNAMENANSKSGVEANTKFKTIAREARQFAGDKRADALVKLIEKSNIEITRKCLGIGADAFDESFSEI